MEIKFLQKKQPIIHDEISLLNKAAMGDQEAYGLLYIHYQPKIFKYINGMLNSWEESEGIVHDIFLNIWENKQTLLNIQSFNSYLYKTAKNKLINLHEHRKVQQKATKYLSVTSKNQVGSADEEIIYKQYENIFLDAMNLLPPKRRIVFEMRVYQELSNDEIASQLKISKSMVKKQLYAATKHVKDYMFQNSGIIASFLFFSSSIITLFNSF